MEKETLKNNIKQIPAQLQKDEFGFVKLLKNSKRPFEKEWQKNPYKYTEIKEWVEAGNNYGILGGYGNLIVIDADTEDLKNVIETSLPKTFTVKTPKKGFHYYYICKGIPNKIVLKDSTDNHLGEVIASGSQAVGAGSIHPDTNTEYSVDSDTNIAEITAEQLYKAFKDYLPGPEMEKEIHPSEKALIQQYGEPYYINSKGILTSINQSFWAALHSKEHIEIYEPTGKEFYRYDEKTGLYKEISEDVIKQEISRRLLLVSREQFLMTLEQRRTNASLNQIISHLKGIEERKAAFADKKKTIHLTNGVIEFKEDNMADFVEFSPRFYSRNSSPIIFDENAKCERFLNELLRPALQEDDIVLLQKYVGLCLLGNNLIQRFLILDGKAGRGKSTLADIIQGLIGLNNVSELRTRHLGERFELYRYRKKTLLIGVDVPGKFLSEKGAYVIKGLVGGDWFDAEQKGGTGNFQLKGNYCIVITSNSKLHVKLDGDLGAWKRRLLIIEFNAPKPKKKIPNFAGILLKEESSGILNWALEGLALLFDDIETYGDILLSDRQQGIVDGLLAESDSLRHFLEENVVGTLNGDLTVNEIIEKYAEYCPTKGWNSKPITVIQKDLDELMLEMFQTSKSHSIKRGNSNFRGFRKVTFKEQV